MNNTLTSTMGKIPGIGDIPILGLLFKSKAHQKNQTELVVMITPTIIKKGQMGVSEGLPSLVEPYLQRPDKTYPSPDPFTGSPRYPADQPEAERGQRSGGDAATPGQRADARAARAGDHVRRRAGAEARADGSSSGSVAPDYRRRRAVTPAAQPAQAGAGAADAATRRRRLRLRDAVGVAEAGRDDDQGCGAVGERRRRRR